MSSIIGLASYFLYIFVFISLLFLMLGLQIEMTHKISQGNKASLTKSLEDFKDKAIDFYFASYSRFLIVFMPPSLVLMGVLWYLNFGLSGSFSSLLASEMLGLLLIIFASLIFSIVYAGVSALFLFFVGEKALLSNRSPLEALRGSYDFIWKNTVEVLHAVIMFVAASLLLLIGSMPLITLGGDNIFLQAVFASYLGIFEPILVLFKTQSYLEIEE